jgi:hypothetical protein
MHSCLVISLETHRTLADIGYSAVVFCISCALIMFAWFALYSADVSDFVAHNLVCFRMRLNGVASLEQGTETKADRRLAFSVVLFTKD